MKMQLMKLPFMSSVRVAELDSSAAMHNTDMPPLLPHGGVRRTREVSGAFPS